MQAVHHFVVQRSHTLYKYDIERKEQTRIAKISFVDGNRYYFASTEFINVAFAAAAQSSAQSMREVHVDGRS
jgi:hypothetical protein